ncbi:MAG: ABC transporter ATP-binding protein [Anaerolineae bacterium]
MAYLSTNGAAAPVFDVDSVHFSYDGRQTALDGVSLRIKAGEKIAILGSNGSGKSTLLKLLDGLYFPTSGEIRYRGVTLSEAKFNEDDSFSFGFRRGVSLVFQDTDVQLFSPTVWEEVAFAPLQLDIPDDEVRSRVDAALCALRIQHLAERTPHRLSGGEKRRVALASVLSLGPDVWLLDEPTTGLDPRSQSWLIDFILERSAAGETFITATHDLDIVSIIADRVYVFAENHKIVAEGTPAEILSNHDLLLECNLIHEHSHRHGELVHSHPHGHDAHATHEHAA